MRDDVSEALADAELWRDVFAEYRVAASDERLIRLEQVIPELRKKLQASRGDATPSVAEQCLDGLDRMLDIAVPAYLQEGGTYVIPGHGRVGDEADILTFRDMLFIVRARVADLVKQGKTLAQVQAARPALDYDLRYGNDKTSADFVAAIYTSLKARDGE